MRPRARVRAAGPLAVIVFGAMFCATPASAAEQVTAAPPNRYVTTDVTIDQGEKVTIFNTDVAEHDVLARDKGPDEKPLFRSDLTGFGGTADVKGTEYLTTGSYRFFCSLHPQMEGSLNVNSAGKPVPRPGTASGSVRVRVLDTRVSQVKRQRGLRVSVTTGGAATVRMTARANRSTFASGTAKLPASTTRTIKLPLSAAGRRLVGRARRIAVSLEATATSSDGKTSRSSAKATLR